MTVATQTLEQLRKHNDEIVPAIFGNCGTLVSFRVSGEDAVLLAREFASDVIATQLENLPDYELYLRTLVLTEGSTALMASHAERHTAYPPFNNNNDAQEQGLVIKTSFERYTRHRATVDDWLAKQFAHPESQKASSGLSIVSKKKRTRRSH